MTDYIELRERFAAFHKENPDVWRRFANMANQLAANGRTRYSHDTIISVIRFERDLATTSDDGFKIANEMKAFYGRMWMHRYGDRFPGFFTLRQMKGEPDGFFAKYHQTGAQK